MGAWEPGINLSQTETAVVLFDAQDCEECWEGEDPLGSVPGVEHKQDRVQGR